MCMMESESDGLIFLVMHLYHIGSTCILILTPFNNIHVQMNDCQSKDEEQVHIHANNNKSVRCTYVQEQVHIECTIIV